MLSYYQHLELLHFSVAFHRVTAGMRGILGAVLSVLCCLYCAVCLYAVLSAFLMKRKPADIEDSCTLICAAFVKIPQMVETFAADLEDHGRLTCMLPS